MKRSAQTLSGDPLQKVSQKNCSNTNHSDVPAKLYCPACSKFLCEGCEEYHAFMFPDHVSSTCSDLSSLENIFTGKCPKHPDCMLDYLCRTHNVLCCSKCKLGEDGTHTECDVAPIKKDMCDELPVVSTLLQKCIRNVKVDKLGMLKRKQQFLEDDVKKAKKSIVDTFKEVREILNEREKKLMDDLDKVYEEWDNSDLILSVKSYNEAEKILGNLNKAPRNCTLNEAKIRTSLNYICDAKKIINELKNMEKVIDDILVLKTTIKFEWDKNMLEQLKEFGYIPKREEFSFGWKEPPPDLDESRRYLISCENPNVVSKIDKDEFFTTIVGNASLPLNKLVTWKIKLVNSINNDGKGIFIGVAPSDINPNVGYNNEKCGWYFNCYDSALYSGSPLKYKAKEYGLRKKNGKYVLMGDSVDVVMDTTNGDLSFILNGVNLGVAFEGIPLDKPLVPCIILFFEGDSVEIVPSKQITYIQLDDDDDRSRCFIQ